MFYLVDDDSEALSPDDSERRRLSEPFLRRFPNGPDISEWNNSIAVATRMDSGEDRIIILHDLAVTHTDHSMSPTSDFRGMRDKDERLAVLAIEPFHELHDLLGRLSIQITRWLIGPNHGRLWRQCSRDGYALLLPARKLVWTMPQSMLQSDLFQRPQGSFARIRVRAASQQKRQLHILESVQHR
jgi:hypothetical protein